MHLPDNALLRGNTYRIIRFISSGGFGCTYEAEHIMLHKRIAIKEFFVRDFCNRDSETRHVTVGTQSKAKEVEKFKAKFIDEAVAISQMQHAHIVNVSDVFEENGTAYYVMDFIDGQSLGDMIKFSGPFNEERALCYIRQVADALRYVHSMNRLHLDLKPGNIMIDAKDNAILIDFGASKHYDEASGEQTSTLLGINTPGYAPAEQMSRTFKSFAPSADIYALGATLYKTLSGVTPPDAISLITGELELAPLPATISEATRHAVEQAMQLRSKSRPQNIDAFLALLSANQPAQTSPSVDDDEVEATVYEATRPVAKPKPVVKPQAVARPKVVAKSPNQPEVQPVSDSKASVDRKTARKDKITIVIIVIIGIGLIFLFMCLTQDRKTASDNSIYPSDSYDYWTEADSAVAPEEYWEDAEPASGEEYPAEEYWDEAEIAE